MKKQRKRSTNETMKAFSFKSWSSDKQSAGDSLDRLTEKALQICNRHGWHLDEFEPEDAPASDGKCKIL